MQMGKCLTWEDHWAASWKNLTSFHSTPSMRTVGTRPPDPPAPSSRPRPRTRWGVLTPVGTPRLPGDTRWFSPALREEVADPQLPSWPSCRLLPPHPHGPRASPQPPQGSWCPQPVCLGGVCRLGLKYPPLKPENQEKGWLWATVVKPKPTEKRELESSVFSTTQSQNIFYKNSDIKQKGLRNYFSEFEKPLHTHRRAGPSVL